MSMLNGTKHIRIDAETHENLRKMADVSGLSIAEVASLCVDDCLIAFKSHMEGGSATITPRVVRVLQAVEAGLLFADKH
jgi:hypothetical protein